VGADRVRKEVLPPGWLPAIRPTPNTMNDYILLRYLSRVQMWRVAHMPDRVDHVPPIRLPWQEWLAGRGLAG
jgi:hypothetical protein